ncbi:MAG: translation initiation factor IF-2 [Nitrospirae bacterium]|nr:translation initiation factor IF-2 [Candidatus Troglogloeales bacterium]
MKVYEIAEELKLTAKELLLTAKQLGIEATHHRNALSDQDMYALFDYYKKNPKTGTDLKQKTVMVAAPSVPKPDKSKPTPVTLPLPAIKKTHILVKKKLPEPIILPVPLSEITPPPIVMAPVPAVEGLVVKEAPLPAPTEDVAAPASMTPLTSPEILIPPAVGVPTLVVSPRLKNKEAAPTLLTPVSLSKAPMGKLAEQEHKKGKLDLKPEFKKGLSGKSTKDKGKKTFFTPWNPKVISGEFSASESRKWQDFRPTHKRQDHKTSQKNLGENLEITKPRRKVIKLYEGLTLKEFSELIGQKVSTLIFKLMQLGTVMTINQPIGLEEALHLAEEFGVPVELSSDKTEEEILRPPAPADAEDPSRLTKRPPVVTIMGHVDHGKTSLLDAIRETKVMEGEAGGITQHIGAYTVTVHDTAVTFIDTPGHEAFTAMRARGAKVTDIVVLVVSADDGVMPQTIEAINHARAANVPIIVAINKIDKPEANPERVKTSLTEYDLIPEAWGGKTIFAEISAKKKIGLPHLLEMILLQAEILELKGNPQKPMGGVIIEAKLDRGRGPVATVLVQEGTLRVGDAFVAGVQAGRVRALINDMGEKVKEAGIAMPVEVIGFMGVPSAGDTFVVTIDERVAKDVAQDRMHRQRLIALAHSPRVTLTDFFSKIQEGAVKELRLIIKADVQGSSGALSESIEKLSTSAVKVRVIHKGVGRITESDVLLASASEAIVIGFNVRPDPAVATLAEQEKVDLRLYSIIYDAISDVKAAMEGLLDPTFTEKVLGRAEVRKTFQLPKAGVISGCYVHSGAISKSGTKARVLRDGVVIYEGKLSSLRRFKDDAKEVSAGFECGIGIENFNDMKLGDIIEVYTEEAVAAKL